jgi:hypothetical protein
MAYKFEKAVAHFIRFELEDYPQSIRWTTDGVSWNVVNDPEGSSAEQACKEIILSVIKDDSHYQGWVKRTHKQVSAASAFKYVSSWFGDNNVESDAHKEDERTRYVLTLSKPDGGVERILDTLPKLVEDTEETNKDKGLMILKFCIPVYEVRNYETGVNLKEAWVWWNDRGEYPEYAPTDELMYTIEKPIKVVDWYMWEGENTEPREKFDAHLHPLPHTYTNVRQYIEYVYDKSPDRRVISLVPELNTKRWWDSKCKK